MKITFLKAFNGDCIYLSYTIDKKNRNILIDGGMPNTYCSLKGKKGKSEDGELKALIESLREKNEKIDLLILTHVDDDHIGGILRWFEKDGNALDMVDQIWFNSGRLIKESFEQENEKDYDNSIEFIIEPGTETSIAQGVKFEDFIESKNGLWRRELIKSPDILSFEDIEFTILSPNDSKLKLLLKKWEKEEPESLETAAKETDYAMSIKKHIQNDTSFEEDKAVHNGSSISLLLSLQGKKMLFLGDAHPSILVASLQELGFSKRNPLPVDFVKLSHHGSIFNNSKELFELLDSKKYIISTNGNKHLHPHKRLLARLISRHNDCELYFNYPELIERIFSDEDKRDYPNVKLLRSANLNFN